MYHPKLDYLKQLVKPNDPKEEYKIIANIGSGTYGDVFKAIHRESRTPVAVKIMKIDLKDDIHGICQEIHTLRECRHPNIVQFYASYLRVNKLWLCMEYCGGQSMQDIYTYIGRPLEEDCIAFVSRETLHGLHYMHTRGRIHRDIKGANILLTDDGHVKVADFGVAAKLSDSIAKRTTLIGTPYWMAPEVASTNNHGAGYDCKCDIWGVGITAIEYAELQPPMFDQDPRRALQVLATRHYKPPSLHDRHKWSLLFHSFIKYCLIKNSKQRPDAAKLLTHEFVANQKLSAATTQRLLTFKRHLEESVKRTYASQLENSIPKLVNKKLISSDNNDNFVPRNVPLFANAQPTKITAYNNNPSIQSTNLITPNATSAAISLVDDVGAAKAIQPETIASVCIDNCAITNSEAVPHNIVSSQQIMVDGKNDNSSQRYQVQNVDGLLREVMDALDKCSSPFDSSNMNCPVDSKSESNSLRGYANYENENAKSDQTLVPQRSLPPTPNRTRLKKRAPPPPPISTSSSVTLTDTPLISATGSSNDLITLLNQTFQTNDRSFSGNLEIQDASSSPSTGQFADDVVIQDQTNQETVNEVTSDLKLAANIRNGDNSKLGPVSTAPPRPPPPKLDGNHHRLNSHPHKAVSPVKRGAPHRLELGLGLPPTPKVHMGACFLQIFESCPLKVNVTATWVHPETLSQIILFGTNDGIYYLDLVDLADGTLELLVPRKCVWLSVVKDTMMSLSGQHRRLYSHNLVSLMKSKTSQTRFFNKRFQPTIKVPETRGCYIASIARSPSKGTKYLCGLIERTVFVMEWYNPRKTFIDVKRIDVQNLPVPVLNFDLIMCPDQILPIICFGVSRTSDQSRYKLHCINPNTDSFDGSAWLDHSPSEELLQVIKVIQLDDYLLLICFPTYATIVHMNGCVLFSKDGRKAEFQFGKTVDSVVRLLDSILVFHTHGLIGIDFTGRITQDIDNDKLVYRLLGNDRVIVVESRPSSDPMSNSNLHILVGHEDSL